MIFRRKKETQKPSPTPKEIRAHYDYFIKNIPNHMEKAKQWLGKERLDYSLEEINKFGKHYRKIYKKSKQNGQWYNESYEVFITYCGETFIKYFNGKWQLNLEKRTYGYGEPMIMRYGPKNYHWMALNISDWLRLIEDGDKDSLSLVYSRKINMFHNTPGWNFDPIENVKKAIENE